MTQHLIDLAYRNRILRLSECEAGGNISICYFFQTQLKVQVVVKRAVQLLCHTLRKFVLMKTKFFSSSKSVGLHPTKKRS